MMMTSSPNSILDGLRQTTKGRLQYDSKWKEEGRTKEIVNTIKESLSTLRLSSKDCNRSFTLANSNNGDTNDSIQSSTTDSTDNGDDFIDLNHSTTINVMKDVQLDNYEKQREESVQRRVESVSNELNMKSEHLFQSIENEMRNIQKKYLLQTIVKQKQYEEEYQQLLQELECMKQSHSVAAESLTKSSNLKLKEIEEKHKQLLREEKLKQQQRDECCRRIADYRHACATILAQCDQQLSSTPDDNLQLLRTKLVGYSQDLEFLALSKSEFSPDDVTLAESLYNQSLLVQENFVSQLEVIVASKATPPSPPSPVVKPLTPASPGPSKQPEPKQPLTPKTELSSRNIYVKYQVELVKFEEDCRAFAENPANRDRKNQIQLLIRTTINTICNVSIEHLKDKLNRLLQLFSGKTVQNKGKQLSCKGQDYSLQFAINTAVKAFLGVVCKQKNICLMLAPVIVILWANYPKFGEIFLAHLYLTCPYAIPYYPVRQKEQSDLEYMVTCGYQLDKEGKLETDEMFHVRMGPLIELYSAIVQCNLPEQHPQDLDCAWRWLARMLNEPPRPGITALVLDSFLSISSHKLYSVYGRQFTKLIKYIQFHYVRALEAITEKSERQTLIKFKSLLADTIKSLNSRDPKKSLTPAGLVPNYFFAKSYVFMATNR